MVDIIAGFRMTTSTYPGRAQGFRQRPEATQRKHASPPDAHTASTTPAKRTRASPPTRRRFHVQSRCSPARARRGHRAHIRRPSDSPPHIDEHSFSSNTTPRGRKWRVLADQCAPRTPCLTRRVWATGTRTTPRLHFAPFPPLAHSGHRPLLHAHMQTRPSSPISCSHRRSPRAKPTRNTAARPRPCAARGNTAAPSMTCHISRRTSFSPPGSRWPAAAGDATWSCSPPAG
ncbi:hypothetical protein C8R44DRAFT_891843 [Mycena epipterygia]|nr:hypothetical protein C8R44DRAFT_891843 [Mycena epipterygia]